MKRLPSRRTRSVLVTGAVACLVLGAAIDARADEEDDIQSRIDAQKTGVTDLEKLDSRQAADSEIQPFRNNMQEPPIGNSAQ